MRYPILREGVDSLPPDIVSGVLRLCRGPDYDSLYPGRYFLQAKDDVTAKIRTTFFAPQYAHNLGALRARFDYWEGMVDALREAAEMQTLPRHYVDTLINTARAVERYFLGGIAKIVDEDGAISEEYQDWPRPGGGNW